MYKGKDGNMWKRIWNQTKDLIFKGDHSRLYQIAFMLLVVIFVLQALFPIYWLFISSIKPISELYDRDQALIPGSVNFSGYMNIWTFMDFAKNLLNSFIISGSATIIILFIGSLAGYVLGRTKIKGKTAIMVLILALSMFPQVSFLLPLFEAFSRYQLLDTHIAMILPDSAYLLPVGVLALRAFYSQIPQDLERAARVNGCTRLGALRRVIIPLSMPGFVSVGLMMFTLVYNEFFFANLFSMTKASQPAPVAVLRFELGYYQPWDLVTAASIVCTIPILLVMILAHKQVLKGLMMRGGV